MIDRSHDTDTPRDWQRQGRDFTLVDTLPTDSFADGHLPRAINIVSDDILNEAPARLADKDATIVVYCASESCKRAGLSAERLASLGYSRIESTTWVKKGLGGRGAATGKLKIYQ